MREKKERGAIVVEAIISMTSFMFAIMIILSVADIAYTQSKIAIALNSAAKEISQYCYLYYKFQLDSLNAKVKRGTEEAEKMVNDTVDGLGQMMDSFGGAGGDFQEDNFTSAVNKLEAGATAANQTIGSLAKSIAENPKGFVVGMGKLAGRELTEAAKVYLGQSMATVFMSKNLKSSSGDEPDAFLRRLHVADGMDGLDFHYTSLMAYGSSNEIHLVCTYRIQVIRLLNFEVAFTFCQSAKTMAWGDGVSIVTPRSIWTSMDKFARGKYIVAKEKEGFHYTSSGHGFDAFVNTGDRNEFVSIVSMDTSSASYQDVNGIKNKLSGDFKALEKGVSKLEDPITVLQNGQEKSIPSDPDTRTYRLLLVIPEGTSPEYKEMVKEAIAGLQEKYPDKTISVDVKEGYGTLREKTETEKTEKEG